MNDTTILKVESSEKFKKIIILEYQSLRDEIIKRIEIGHQVVSLTLISVGAFLSVGLHPVIRPSILLVYPILALFLAAGWAHNDLRIRQIANYIRKTKKKRPMF